MPHHPPSRSRSPPLPTRGSCLPVPVPEVPEVVVPAAERSLELAGDGGNARPIDDRDHRLVAACQVVHADEQGRALDRVELPLGRAERLVVLLAPPARDVAALPLVLLGGDLP